MTLIQIIDQVRKLDNSMFFHFDVIKVTKRKWIMNCITAPKYKSDKIFYIAVGSKDNYRIKDCNYWDEIKNYNEVSYGYVYVFRKVFSKGYLKAGVLSTSKMTYYERKKLGLI